MMDIFLLLIILLIFPFTRVNLKSFNNNYLDKNNTSIINGIFILIVFLSHSLSYFSINNHSLFSKYLVVFLGQLMVSMFLFYSGYGVLESIKNKDKYVSNMPKKRIFKILINFDLVVLIYAIIFFIINGYLSKKKLLLSLIGWDSIGNSNWYIFDILILYIITYISFSIFDKDKKKGIILTTFLSIVFIIFLYRYKDTYWYNTILCYPFGMLFSLYKEKLNKFCLTNKYILILLISIISFLVFKMYEFTNPLLYLITSVIFCFIILLITMKIEIKNKVLKWFGENLFWIYILQRIPMIILINYYSNIKNYYFILMSFIATICLCLIRNIFIKIYKLK